MHRQSSKQRLRTQLAILYSIMSIAVVGAVILLIMIVLGYRFNSFDGKVEQGGLVQFDSRPAGANVMVDGVSLANKTPSKLTVSSGSHNFSISRDGYSTWQKDVTVKPGGVLWLNYARLLPIDLKTNEVASLVGATSSRVSKDRKSLAAVEDASQPAITIFDLNSSKLVPRRIGLTAGSFTAPSEGQSQNFSIEAWDNDNRYLLVRHVFGDRSEYLSVDTRGNTEAQNISTLLGIDIAKISFNLASSKEFVILTTGHEVRLGDIENRTISGPVLSNIDKVNQSDRSTLVYTSRPNESGLRQAGYLTLGSSAPRIVRTVADPSVVFEMRFGRYYNQNYIVAVIGDQAEILSGGLPSSESDATLTWKREALLQANGGVDYVGFSSNENRFVYIQKGAEMSTYDLELATATHATLANQPTRQVDWIDSYHLGVSAGGKAGIADFDGTNFQLIAGKSVLDLPIAISEDNRFVYHFASKDSGGVALMRTRLTIN